MTRHEYHHQKDSLVAYGNNKDDWIEYWTNNSQLKIWLGERFFKEKKYDCWECLVMNLRWLVFWQESRELNIK